MLINYYLMDHESEYRGLNYGITGNVCPLIDRKTSYFSCNNLNGREKFCIPENLMKNNPQLNLHNSTLFTDYFGRINYNAYSGNTDCEPCCGRFPKSQPLSYSSKSSELAY